MKVMRRASFFALFGIVVALGLGAAALYYLPNGRQERTMGQSVPSPHMQDDLLERASQARQRVDGPESTETADAGIWQGSYGVSSASYAAGLDLLKRRYGQESQQVASYQMHWSYVCREANNERNRLARPQERPPASDQGMTGAIQRLLVFCRGAPAYEDLEAAGLYQKGTRVAFSLRLTEIEKQYGVDAAFNFAESYLRDADDPFEVRAPLDYLNGIDVMLPPERLWREDNPRRRHEVYQMARDRYLCDEFGGCGPNHPASLDFCLRTRCETLGSYEVLVRRQLAPAEMPLYDWYLNAFGKLRD